MDERYKLLLENINKNGLLPSAMQQNTALSNPLERQHSEVITAQSANFSDMAVGTNNSNIFSQSAAIPTFGALTLQTKQQAQSKETAPIANLDGFDTDILSNSTYRKIDDKTLKLKVKIARLKVELEEHKKLVEATYLKADKNQYQKLLEIQQKMEAEIQRLVVEYQNRQLKSVVFSPFAKLFQLLKNYVVLR